MLNFGKINMLYTQQAKSATASNVSILNHIQDFENVLGRILRHAVRLRWNNGGLFLTVKVT